MMTRVIGVLIACAALNLAVDTANAQVGRRQAFDSYDTRRPTTSPYLQLLNNQGAGLPQYQTLVRPLLDQRQINLQQSGQIQGLQAQQSQLAQQARQTRYGNQTLRPTGTHATRMNFIRADGRSSFYPALSAR